MDTKHSIKTITVLLIGSLLFTSCVGSFKLTNNLLAWNRNLDNKFVNELVFLAFCIVPVYEITLLADSLVLNSIEFWSGRNPISADVNTTKTVETPNGKYAIETKSNGYHIQKEGNTEAVDLVFDEDSQIWSVVANGETHKLLQFTDNKDEVVMFLPDGKEMNVELSQAGTLAFRQVAEGYTYFAAR